MEDDTNKFEKEINALKELCKEINSYFEYEKKEAIRSKAGVASTETLNLKKQFREIMKEIAEIEKL
jgi:hypothetical protein